MTHLCLDLQKDSQKDVGHSSDMDQKQSGIYGAVSDLCEEYSACQTSTVRPVLADNLTHCSRQQTYW